MKGCHLDMWGPKDPLRPSFCLKQKKACKALKPY